MSADFMIHEFPKHGVALVSPITPSTPVLNESKSVEFAYWGDDNNYPSEIYEICKKNSIIPSTIEWKARAIRSGGLRYGSIEHSENGDLQFKSIFDPRIDEFLERTNIDLYLEESLSDLFWFSHAFVELGINKHTKQITSLVAQEAMFCRFQKQNEKGKIEHVFLSANWPKYDKKYTIKVKVIDPYWDPVAFITKASESKYIYPISYTSPGRIYYQEPSWHSLINGSWLELANSIPELKKYLLKNQMNIKYLVFIPSDWWDWRYPGFNTPGKFTDKERAELEKTVRTKFNNTLTGVEKAGGSLFMTFKTDRAGKEFAKWEIKVLDDKASSNAYIEDSQEASSHILYALGVDGTLIGNAPGKGMGAGSGSDKRVAWNIFQLNSKPYQDKVLAPLNLVARYNKWIHNGKPIKFWFANFQIAKLDSGKEVKSAD